MNKPFILLSALALSSTAKGAAKVEHFELSENVLQFATADTKSHSLPSCVEEATNQMWAVSIDTPEGRAIYSLLITAVANDLAIEVLSSGECVNDQSLEKALSVSLRF